MTRRSVQVARTFREKIGDLFDMEPREYLRFLRQVMGDLADEIGDVEREVKKFGD